MEIPSFRLFWPATTFSTLGSLSSKCSPVRTLTSSVLTKRTLFSSTSWRATHRFSGTAFQRKTAFMLASSPRTSWTSSTECLPSISPRGSACRSSRTTLGSVAMCSQWTSSAQRWPCESQRKRNSGSKWRTGSKWQNIITQGLTSLSRDWFPFGASVYRYFWWVNLRKENWEGKGRKSDIGRVPRAQAQQEGQRRRGRSGQTQLLLL